MRCAPGRYLAFANAFRYVNRHCFESMAKSLMDLSRNRLREDKDGSELIAAVANTLSKGGHFGLIEVQVWWGDEFLTLPSHVDGATSLLDMGLTLGGQRTVRMGTFAS